MSSKIGNSIDFRPISFLPAEGCQKPGTQVNNFNTIWWRKCEITVCGFRYINCWKPVDCWLRGLPLWETRFGSYGFTPNPEFFVCHWQYNYLSIYWQHIPVFFPQKYWETDWKCVRLQRNWQTFLFGMTRKKNVSVPIMGVIDCHHSEYCGLSRGG